MLTTTVNGLPTNGSTVYVTLNSLVGGAWLNNAYTYTADSAAAGGIITTPTPGSTLSGSSVTFSWTAGAGASAYWLVVGSTAGGTNYYSSELSGLTATVNGLPTNGSTVYVTLYSLIGGAWAPNAYTYTAVTAAAGGVITTPTPGSTLSGGSVTFRLDGGGRCVGLLAGSGKHGGRQQLLLFGAERADGDGKRTANEWRHYLRDPVLGCWRAVVEQGLHLCFRSVRRAVMGTVASWQRGSTTGHGLRSVPCLRRR